MSGKTEGQSAFHFSPRPNRAAEIDWHEWGPETLSLAKEQDKPVLLSIAASWCHWCHVLDEKGFSDGDVINLANERYIPVRVDNDRRPDVNKRFNQGGWPTIALLTAGGEIIAGTTYLEPVQLKLLLREVANLYAENRPEIDAAVAKIQQERAGREQAAPGGLDEKILAYVLEVAGEVYDQEFAGFGSSTKFPYPALLSFILSVIIESPIGELEDMLAATLDRMAAGGMYDRVEGGFFRYSTDREWTTPHYEKLLDDNAALLGVYAQAALVFGSHEYEKIARDIFGYLTSVLRDDGTGAFGGSQDADEEYYRLDKKGRAGRTAPSVDRTVYAHGNAVAASSLLRAFQVFGDEEFRQSALAALDFVWEKMWDSKLGVFHYHDGKPRVAGLLADTAALAGACLDAYESGAGEEWLSRAIETAAWMLASLEDPETGGFYDCAEAPGSEGLAAEKTRPPVENSIAAAMLVRLQQGTGQVRFGGAAERALQFYAGSYKELGLFAADYAAAVQRFLATPVRVTIAGPPSKDDTIALILAAHRARIPFKSIEVLDPDIHGEELEETGFGYAGKAIAHICVGSSCQPAVTDPETLPGRLEAGWTGANR